MSPSRPTPRFLTGGARLAGVLGWPVAHSRSPALHSHWLRRYGIAPPHCASDATRPLRFRPRDLRCPRCDSTHTERISEFGSTACKALYRCLACREPFDYFKPI